jgi:copper chaperone CopZ
MKYTEKEIIKRITSELDECLESVNAEIYNYSGKIVSVDTERQTITIKFDYNVVEEDDYVGLAFY